MDASDEGKQERACITQLPDDLLSLIYQKLNLVRDRIRFSVTSRRFLDIAILSCKCLRDATSSTKLRKSYSPSDSIVVGRYLHCFWQLNSASPPLMCAVNLSCTSITDNGLETLTKYCNKALVNVNLKGCRHITNTGIWFLAQNCPQLEAVNISDCIKVVGVKSEQVFSSTLTYLEADARVLYPVGLLSGGGVEHLKVHNSKNLYKDKRGLKAIGSVVMKNLKMLWFSEGSYISNECIMEISKGCPFLQELNARRCSGIGLTGWASVGLHCQNLERLHVDDSEDLCDKGLLALTNGCKLLSVLYVGNCRHVTSAGIRRFMIHRPDVHIM